MTIRLNPDLQIQEQRIGDDARCVIVDDFLADADTRIELAVDRAERFREPKIGYPGLMLTLDPGLLRDFDRFILRRMGEQFSFLRGGATLQQARGPDYIPAHLPYGSARHAGPQEVRGARLPFHGRDVGRHRVLPVEEAGGRL